MTESLGQSQVIPYLIGLKKLGHNISILSTEKEKDLERSEKLIQKTLDDNKINWYFVNYTKKPPIVSTLKDILKLWKKAKELQEENAFDIVHCRSYIPALLGVKMKQKYGCKFIFDMRGFWADERVDGKIWDLKSPLFNQVYKFFKRKEKLFFEQADHTISLTHNAKNRILKFENIENQPIDIEVIPCCVDTNRFDPKKISKLQKTELRKELGIKEDDFVLNYLGSIGTWYMLDEMLDFFKVLLSKKPNAKFLIITGESKEYIHSAAKKKGIDISYFIIKKTNYTEVPLYLSLADYSIFFILPVFSKSASSPIKQGEIMSMGIPIICNSGVGDTDFVINKYDCGVLVNNFTEKDYNEAIDIIDSKTIDPIKTREAAKDFYGLEMGVAMYEKTYKKVLGI